MVGLMLYIFIMTPANSVQLTGTVISLAGIMMGLASLSDITRISEKEKKALLKPNNVKRQLFFLFIGVAVLIAISTLFFSLRFIFPKAEQPFIKDFTKLGYDCLVMILGFLCLIKQFADQVTYAKDLVSKTEMKSSKTY
jgi:hypothetical protein